MSLRNRFLLQIITLLFYSAAIAQSVDSTISSKRSSNSLAVTLKTDDLKPGGISVTDLRQLETMGYQFSIFPQFIDENGNPLPITKEEFEKLSVKVISEPNVGFNLRKNKEILGVEVGLKPFSCECFTTVGTDSAIYEISIPQTKSTREITGVATIITNIRDVPILVKCLTFIIWTFLTILFAIYVIGIINKPRFNKAAYMQYKSMVYGMPPKQRKYVLQTSFFNRWLVPYLAEKKLVQGLQFIAGKSKNHIYLAKQSQTKNTIVNGTPILKTGVRDIKILNKQAVQNQSGNKTTTYQFVAK